MYAGGGIIYTFCRKHIAAISIIATGILRASITRYGAIPALRFRNYLFTFIWHASGSIYFGTNACVTLLLPSAKVVSKLTWFVLKESANCEEVEKKKKRKKK